MITIADIKRPRVLDHTKKYDKIMQPPRKNININTNSELCRCKICGKVLNILTHVHAESHGYKDKYAMIADGQIEFFYKEAEK